MKTIHTCSKEKALNHFTKYTRIKIADQEDSFLKRLEEKIDRTGSSYEEKTIEMKMKNGAIPGLSVASIAGIVVGTVAESPILLGGAFFGLLISLGFQIRKLQ